MSDEFDVFDKDIDANGNNGRLKGFQCPECMKFDCFEIEVTTVMEIYDNGTGNHDEEQSKELADSAYAKCDGCGHEGTVLTFKEGYVTVQTKKKNAPKCPYCKLAIEPGEPVASTPQGSMHPDCATAHEEENPEEW